MCCLHLKPVVLLRQTQSLLSSSSMPLASKSKMVVGMKHEVADGVQKCSDFKQTNKQKKPPKPPTESPSDCSEILPGTSRFQICE